MQGPTGPQVRSEPKTHQVLFDSSENGCDLPQHPIRIAVHHPGEGDGVLHLDSFGDHVDDVLKACSVLGKW